MVERLLPEIFRELIECLNESDVKYLLIGGWAFSIYAEPRLTKDIDFLVAMDDENLKKLHKAIVLFGGPPVNMEGFKTNYDIITFGSPPMRVDFLKGASGIDISDCYERKEVLNVEGLKIHVISKADLIKNKRASGRPRDIADVIELEKIKTKFDEK